MYVNRFGIVFVAVLAIAAGCASSGGEPQARPSHPAQDDSAACGADRVEELTLRHDDIERTYRLAVPPAATTGVDLPLVLDFHGASADAALQAQVSAFEQLGMTAGFIVVTPDGLNNRWSSNDVAFIDALLDEVVRETCVDEHQVFAAGMSNGGFFSSTLACQRAERFAAIATVTGISFPSSCDPANGVAVIHFHGDADAIVSFDGIPSSVAQWAVTNGCTSDPDVTTVSAEIEHRRYTDCEPGAPVSFYVVSGGGHTWPGSETTRDFADRLGYTTMDIDATELAWEFFQANADNDEESLLGHDYSAGWTFSEAETASGLRYRVASRGEGHGTLLLHLHGATQTWASLHSDIQALAAMIDHSGTTDAIVIVAPLDATGWSMWTNSADGSHDIATLITEDLLPEIEADFSAGGAAERRVLSGFSMGGFGAASIGLSDPSYWRTVAIWDGAMHTWETLRENRKHIATNHFGNDRRFFDEFSPWSLAETQTVVADVPPIFVAHGSLPAFIPDYAAHLQHQGINVTEFETNCRHALACLTREVGDEFTAIAFD